MEQYRGWIGKGLRNLVEQAYRAAGGREGVGEEIDPWYQRLKGLYGGRAATETPIYGGVPQMLHHCAQRAQMAVLSNKIEAITQQIVSHIFPNTFDSVCGLVAHHPMKPDPARVHALLQTHGVARDDCLLIGDSSIDYHTARRAKVKFCAARWGYEDLTEYGAEIIASTPQEIINIVDDLIGV